MLEAPTANRAKLTAAPPRLDLNFIKPDSISLISYPYAPVLSGRGIDRYCYFLYGFLAEVGVHVKIAGVPSVKASLRSVAIAEPRIMWKVWRATAPIFHAVSPVGGRLAAVSNKRPLITSIHDVIPFFLHNYSPMKYTFLRHCISVSARFSDALIVPFEFTKKFIVKKFGIEPKRVNVVNLGVDLDQFHPKTLGQSSGKQILFLGGGFPIIRGGDILLRAFCRASAELDDTELLVSGTGPEEDLLRTLASRLGVSSKVRFLGFIRESELAGYLRSSDLLVHPSRLGFSLSLLQAMACRTPVLVTDDLDLPEAVADAGVVCRSGDVVDLSKAMVRILTDCHLAENMAHRGYQRSKEFSLNRMFLGTLDVYRRFCRGK